MRRRQRHERGTRCCESGDVMARRSPGGANAMPGMPRYASGLFVLRGRREREDGEVNRLRVTPVFIADATLRRYALPQVVQAALRTGLRRRRAC